MGKVKCSLYLLYVDNNVEFKTVQNSLQMKKGKILGENNPWKQLSFLTKNSNDTVFDFFCSFLIHVYSIDYLYINGLRNY